MKSVNLNWALIGSIVAALAGVAGSILTPLYGSSLATSVQAVLQALSGLLVVIPTFHVSSVAASGAKYKQAAMYRSAP
jgi:hypothetical protein